MCDYGNLTQGRSSVVSDGRPVAVTSSTAFEEISSRVEDTIHVRRETKRILERIRSEQSFATWDMVLKDLIEKAYPHRYLL